MNKSMFNWLKKGKNLVFFCISVAITLGSYLFVLSVFRYEDTVSFTAWSVNFWDCFFSNNIGNYYAYSLENVRGALHGAPNGSYLTFLPWIIWNFPLYLFNSASKNPDVGGMKCIIWSKLFLVVCLIVLCVYVFKTLLIITGKKYEFSFAGALIVASSLEVLEAVAYAGQDEIVYLTTFVIALYSFINRKVRQGIILSIITVTLCPIMILPVMVMLFLMEKRIWNLGIYVLLCFIPSILFELCYAKDDIYQAGKTFNTQGIFQLIMNTGTIDTTIGPTSIAVVVIIVLLFAAYFTKITDESRAEALMYYCSIAFFALCFLTYSIWYRYCLYVPFFVMMIGLSSEHRDIKVFLLELLLVFRFIASLSNYYNFNYDYLSNIGKRMLGNASGSVINPVSAGYDNAFYIARAVTLATALLLLIICNKRFTHKLEFKMPWKVVAGIAPLTCAAWCVIIVLNMQ